MNEGDSVGPLVVAPAENNKTVLKVENIRKEFPGTLALDEVSLCLREGEIHGLLGENGAGKSTLIKCICGAYAVNAGTIEVGGTTVTISSPADATAAGIAVVHQHINLVPTLNIAENLWLGESLPRRLGLVDWQKTHCHARKVLEAVAIDVATTALVGDLRSDQLAMIAIAKAVSTDARVIILDEPTTALLPDEVDRLFSQMRALAGRRHSFLYVSHRLTEVFEIADRVTVLRDGRNSGIFKKSDMDRSRVVEAIIGRRGVLGKKRTPCAISGDPRLSVENLYGAGVHGFSMSAAPGEIVGVAGLPGSGSDETLDLLFGRRAAKGGEIRIDGETITMRDPADAIAAGIALVPKDRLSEAILHGDSIRANVSLPSLSRFLRAPPLRLVSRRSEAKAASEVMTRMRVRMPGLESVIDELSGGNQQKVVLGRWLISGAKVFLLNSPTAAVDIGAKSEIYELIDELARDGKSIVFVSTELEEYPVVCDRVLVMNQGRVVSELSGDNLTATNIMTLAAGGQIAP